MNQEQNKIRFYNERLAPFNVKLGVTFRDYEHIIDIALCKIHKHGYLVPFEKYAVNNWDEIDKSIEKFISTQNKAM